MIIANNYFVIINSRQVFILYITYLSMVTATMFIVEERKNPHIRNLVFHIAHSISPKTPSLYNERISFIVKVMKSKTVEAIISRKL